MFGNAPATVRYAVAGLAVLWASLVRIGLKPFIEAHSPYPFFTLAIFIAARFGGRGPGVVATATGAWVVAWFVLEPAHGRALADTGEAVGLASFVFVGLLITWVAARLRESLAELAAAQEGLRRRNELVAHSHDAIITMDPQRRITGWNTGAAALYGWAESDVLGQVAHELLHNEGEIRAHGVDRVLAERNRWEGELNQLTREGRWITTESRHVLVRDDRGLPIGVLAINRDITERKQVEQALRQSHERERARAADLEMVLEALPIAAAVSRDRECREVTGNRHAYELLRWPPFSRIDLRTLNGPVFLKEGRPVGYEELPIVHSAATGQPVYNVELEIRFRDGTSRMTVGSAVPLLEEGGTRGAVAVFMDVTEARLSEERRRRIRKLESIGMLAGGVAHDFNNLLSIVMISAAGLSQERPGCQYTQAILEASQRAAELVRQLLAYAGKDMLFPRALDLKEVIERTRSSLAGSIPEGVRLELRLPYGLPLVEVDPDRIEHVLMALVINAGEAMRPGEGGRIELSMGTREIDSEALRKAGRWPDLRPGLYVWVEVRDNGTGMDAATAARVFDPFFSTKFTGRGLGLAAADGVIRSSGGFIEVETAPGAGTAMRMWLPSLDLVARNQAEGPGPSAPQ